MHAEFGPVPPRLKRCLSVRFPWNGFGFSLLQATNCGY